MTEDWSAWQEGLELDLQGLFSGLQGSGMDSHCHWGFCTRSPGQKLLLTLEVTAFWGQRRF